MGNPGSESDAQARPQLTMRAGIILRDHATEIAERCAAAKDSELVVATVSQELVFSGVKVVPRKALTEQMRETPAGGWELVFEPQSGVGEVEARCDRMIEWGRRRREAQLRNRHGNG